jgi:hypothetical protein
MRIQQVCTPEDWVMSIPCPVSSERRPIKPINRVVKESATEICDPTTVALLLLTMLTWRTFLSSLAFAAGNQNAGDNNKKNSGDYT